MNESITDPVLRTFRRPITERLREKLDDYRGVMDAQSAAIQRLTRDVARLERELRKSRREHYKTIRRNERAVAAAAHGDAPRATQYDAGGDNGSVTPD